jgi:hypothetical protein
MMKIGKLLVMFSLAMALLLFSNQEAQAGSAPIGVKWDNSILIQGQIGRVTILQDTALYKYEKGKLMTIKTLRKGNIYRVYSYKDQNGGVYGLGGGAFVKKSSSIKYETPSKTKRSQLARIVFFDEGDFLKLAKQGIMKGQPFSLKHDDLNDVYGHFGNTPSWEGYYEGGYGRQFGNYIYFTGWEDDPEFTAFMWANDGLTPLTPYIIKNTVGKPSWEGISEMDGHWMMYYYLGYYEVYFSFAGDNRSDLSGILLKRSYR